MANRKEISNSDHSNEYTMAFTCSNCNHGGVYFIPKNKAASDAEIPCRTCWLNVRTWSRILPLWKNILIWVSSVAIEIIAVLIVYVIIKYGTP